MHWHKRGKTTTRRNRDHALLCNDGWDKEGTIHDDIYTRCRCTDEPMSLERVLLTLYGSPVSDMLKYVKINNLRGRYGIRWANSFPTYGDKFCPIGEIFIRFENLSRADRHLKFRSRNNSFIIDSFEEIYSKIGIMLFSFPPLLVSPFISRVKFSCIAFCFPMHRYNYFIIFVR